MCLSVFKEQMRKYIFICFLYFGLYGSSTHILKLGKIIEEARENNPEILAFRAKYEVYKSKTSPFRNLMDPMISTEVSSADMKMYSITQSLPFPTKLSSQSNIARAEAEVYGSFFLEKEQEILSKVKKSYSDLFFLHKRYEVVNESKSFFNQLFNIASQNYSVGKATQADMLRAQVELSKTENDLLKIKDDINIAETRLNILLNRNTESPVGIPGEISTDAAGIPLDSLFGIARENSPALKATLWLKEKAERMKSLANQTYLPDFLFKFTQEEMSGGMTNRKYMVGLSIPVYFWGKQNDKVREARANMKLAEAHFEGVENEVLLKTKEAKINVDNFNRTQALYKNTIIPQAKASLNSVLSAYEANRIDFLSLLESERALISFELEYYKAVSNLYKAVADLERAIGINLTKEREE